MSFPRPVSWTSCVPCAYPYRNNIRITRLLFETVGKLKRLVGWMIWAKKNEQTAQGNSLKWWFSKGNSLQNLLNSGLGIILICLAYDEYCTLICWMFFLLFVTLDICSEEVHMLVDGICKGYDLGFYGDLTLTSLECPKGHWHSLSQWPNLFIPILGMTNTSVEVLKWWAKKPATKWQFFLQRISKMTSTAHDVFFFAFSASDKWKCLVDLKNSTLEKKEPHMSTLGLVVWWKFFHDRNWMKLEETKV